MVFWQIVASPDIVAVGNGLTVNCFVTVVGPHSLVTVKVTVYVPGIEYNIPEGLIAFVDPEGTVVAPGKDHT